ncbi:hypothetical protein BCR44DRAFT_1316568 [Catenaria anguillulae PL171]|uniref:Uncharacterized protein n=1 Tax=Catenaria anguillulae PL171 TaxID=765915 RepID=A0A1Y2H8N6_9FUNG|nr:hypothetical protein BCR44DRAFT_1316568 [Catenaria anguillulae PL171]
MYKHRENLLDRRSITDQCAARAMNPTVAAAASMKKRPTTRAATVDVDPHAEAEAKADTADTGAETGPKEDVSLPMPPNKRRKQADTNSGKAAAAQTSTESAPIIIGDDSDSLSGLLATAESLSDGSRHVAHNAKSSIAPGAGPWSNLSGPRATSPNHAADKTPLVGDYPTARHGADDYYSPSTAVSASRTGGRDRYFSGSSSCADCHDDCHQFPAGGMGAAAYNPARVAQFAFDPRHMAPVFQQQYPGFPPFLPPSSSTAAPIAQTPEEFM